MKNNNIRLTKLDGIHVENDGALAALAEQARGSMRECPNFVAILAGKRLGTGVVLDGKLVYGANGGVGELASLKYVKGLEENTGLIDLIDTVGILKDQGYHVAQGYLFSKPLAARDLEEWLKTCQRGVEAATR